jgi:hypothetical protein
LFLYIRSKSWKRYLGEVLTHYVKCTTLYTLYTLSVKSYTMYTMYTEVFGKMVVGMVVYIVYIVYIVYKFTTGLHDGSGSFCTSTRARFTVLNVHNVHDDFHKKILPRAHMHALLEKPCTSCNCRSLRITKTINWKLPPPPLFDLRLITNPGPKSPNTG